MCNHGKKNKNIGMVFLKTCVETSIFCVLDPYLGLETNHIVNSTLK